MNYLQSALQYHAAGLKIIPFWNRPDGGKSFPDGYAKFRQAQTAADVSTLFGRDADGVCLLCTDGLEAIDIDMKHDPKGSAIVDLLAAMQEFGLDLACTIQKTKSGGNHILYRCPTPSGNLKLARRRGEKEAFLETRGQGGLLFIAPTPGYSVTHGSLLAIPEITQDDRDLLIKICRHLDEPDAVDYRQRVKVSDQMAGQTPWEAFDANTDVLDLLKNKGWTVVRQAGDYIRLNRPGAKHPRGIDGSVISGANLFYPFTSSEQFTPEKAYRPSAVYAILDHGGDFAAAARELYKSGFGARVEQKQNAEPGPSAENIPDLIAAAEKTRFDVESKIVEQRPLLKFNSEREYWVAGRGMIGVFTGHEKSGKSFVLSCLASSGLAAGREVLNFTLDLDGGKMLWFDTEQSEYFYHKTQARIHRQAGIEYNPANYAAYHLRRFSAPERIEIIEHFIYNTPGVSVVVIDGFVDLARDYNNLVEVQELVNRMMRWSDERRVLIMGVLHVNKGDGKIRGHFGSELKNKCDFVINTVQQEGARYQVSNPTSRYGSFPALDFSRDDEGLPVYDHFKNKFSPSQFPTAPAAVYSGIPASAGRNEQDIPF